MKTTADHANHLVIGWREWVALPTLGVGAIKAKVDSGARTSSLHAYDVADIRRRGVERVRFSVHPLQRDSSETVCCEADLLERRWVTTSGGHRSYRPVIRTEVELAGRRWSIELSLTARDAMGFRMLLGRQALRGVFLIDPGRSFRATPRLLRTRPRPVKRKKR